MDILSICSHIFTIDLLHHLCLEKKLYGNYTKMLHTVVYSHEYTSTYTYRIMQNQRHTIITTSEDFFKKICLTLFERFVCERELETEQNCNVLTPALMAISIVSFSFSWCSTEGLGAQLSAGFLYHISSPTNLISNSSGGPEGPFCRLVAFSTTSCHQRIWSLTLRLPVFTE